ncbi:Lysosomal thioesterase PPT2-B [Phytophthora nicotianae]|uniref:Lysosomal thioesterase PPT2-B n=1 Tax=Phytophthora nicotianae TaxID=4792 RepID=A0A0W8DSS4_PHYNI|nr:Lysosomal thioesterase PPT2-B [Phytophthora nicotianae]
MISSAKWHGLPEESKIFARGQSVITFYTDQNCKGDAKSWYVTTQSKSNMHFPENFRLDGINDEISSFKVISAGGDSGPFRVCGPSEKTNLANTSSATTSAGSYSVCTFIFNSTLNSERPPQSTPMASILIVTTALLVTIAQGASYVDLYKNADYKHKLLRVEDIEVDHCYVFACDALDNTITSAKGLNDTITSAKWGGLPERTSTGDDGLISFYVDSNCKKHNIWWRTKTQSDDDLYFPSNFKLDGINDQISSFMVWNTKKIVGIANLQCLGEDWESKTFPNAEMAATPPPVL